MHTHTHTHLKVTLKIVDAPLVMGAMSAGTAAPPSQVSAALTSMEARGVFQINSTMESNCFHVYLRMDVL